MGYYHGFGGERGKSVFPRLPEGYDAAELKKLFMAYLAAGDYRSGAFSNAALIVKGSLLFAEGRTVGVVSPVVWGRL